MNTPAGHDCATCGTRVESVTVDWADDDGRSLVVEETPLWCPDCSSSNAVRRTMTRVAGTQAEISIEGAFGMSRVAGRMTRPRG